MFLSFLYGMPDCTIIDGRFNQSIGDHLVLILVTKNVFNKDYRTEYRFPQPGRILGVDMEIEF